MLCASTGSGCEVEVIVWRTLKKIKNTYIYTPVCAVYGLRSIVEDYILPYTVQ